MTYKNLSDIILLQKESTMKNNKKTSSKQNTEQFVTLYQKKDAGSYQYPSMTEAQAMALRKRMEQAREEDAMQNS